MSELVTHTVLRHACKHSLKQIIKVHAAFLLTQNVKELFWTSSAEIITAKIPGHNFLANQRKEAEDQSPMQNNYGMSSTASSPRTSLHPSQGLRPPKTVCGLLSLRSFAHFRFYSLNPFAALKCISRQPPVQRLIWVARSAWLPSASHLLQSCLLVKQSIQNCFIFCTFHHGWFVEVPRRVPVCACQ